MCPPMADFFSTRIDLVARLGQVERGLDAGDAAADDHHRADLKRAQNYKHLQLIVHALPCFLNNGVQDAHELIALPHQLSDFLIVKQSSPDDAQPIASFARLFVGNAHLVDKVPLRFSRISLFDISTDRNC
jgi:hypothetical protein